MFIILSAPVYRARGQVLICPERHVEVAKKMYVGRSYAGGSGSTGRANLVRHVRINRPDKVRSKQMGKMTATNYTGISTQGMGNNNMEFTRIT
jgi:hypothetical protein